MKKLKYFTKTKEKEGKTIASEEKAIVKAKKVQATPSLEQNNKKPQDLFWDGYSDIGYC